MEILKDIEKNILNINIYEKNKDPLNNANMQKLDTIKKQINEYFKYKDNENNIILQKKLKYDEIMKQTNTIITIICSEHEWDCHWGLCL